MTAFTSVPSLSCLITGMRSSRYASRGRSPNSYRVGGVSQNMHGLAGRLLRHTRKTAKQFEYVAYYVEQNPVVKALVESPEQWDASSASCMDVVSDPWPLVYD